MAGRRPSLLTATADLASFGTWALRPMSAADAPLLMGLAAIAGYGALLEMPANPEEAATLIRRVSAHPWGLPSVLLSGGQAVGAAMLGLPDIGSLRAYLLVLVAEPERASHGLGLYLRHVFWRLPVRRLYAHIPLASGAAPHAGLLEATGFQREGTLRRHLDVLGELVDVAVFALLREDFDRWAATAGSGLAL